MSRLTCSRLAALLLSVLLLAACAAPSPAPSSTLPPSPAQLLVTTVQDGYFTLSLDPPEVLPDGRVRLGARAVYSGGYPFYVSESQTREIMHSDHGREGAFEFVVLNADRTFITQYGDHVYTDVGATTRLVPGDALTGYLDFPPAGSLGYGPLPPGDYWVRMTFSYILADEPAAETWLRSRYVLQLEAPFTVPGR